MISRVGAHVDVLRFGFDDGDLARLVARDGADGCVSVSRAKGGYAGKTNVG